jgi:hypothetical protein
MYFYVIPPPLADYGYPLYFSVLGVTAVLALLVLAFISKETFLFIKEKYSQNKKVPLTLKLVIKVFLCIVSLLNFVSVVDQVEGVDAYPRGLLLSSAMRLVVFRVAIALVFACFVLVMLSWKDIYDQSHALKKLNSPKQTLIIGGVATVVFVLGFVAFLAVKDLEVRRVCQFTYFTAWLLIVATTAMIYSRQLYNMGKDESGAVPEKLRVIYVAALKTFFATLVVVAFADADAWCRQFHIWSTEWALVFRTFSNLALLYLASEIHNLTDSSKGDVKKRNAKTTEKGSVALTATARTGGGATLKNSHANSGASTVHRGSTGSVHSVDNRSSMADERRGSGLADAQVTVTIIPPVAALKNTVQPGDLQFSVV